ncbi:MAG: very short patch repair endonuclease [Pseudomonadota bacterium]
MDARTSVRPDNQTKQASFRQRAIKRSVRYGSDVFSKAKRSEIMSRIKGRDNKDTELALRSILRCEGITGWRRHYVIMGKPDFVFIKLRVAIFVDGCFWHGCQEHFNKPTNNRSFWRKKLATNKSRDRDVNRTLRRNGWYVVRIWEHELVQRHRARLIIRLRRELALGNRPITASPSRKS